jgi:hypothetical protein
MDLKMIIKYSLIQYKRIMTASKLMFIHMILFIPGMGFFIYLMKDGLVSISQSWLSHVLFFIFLFQTMMIVGKRLKNEFFFSTRCYTIFPQKKINIFLYTLVFGIIDLNVVLLIIVSTVMILYVTTWGLLVNVSFLLIFGLCEITYLIYMTVTIEIMTEKYGNSKNLFMITFFTFMFLELFTRLAEKFYLFDLYPISGWIGSTVLNSLKGDFIEVLLYFSITIIAALIGLFLLYKVTFPKKNNVFESIL